VIQKVGRVLWGREPGSLKIRWPFLQSQEQIANLPCTRENVEILSNIGEEHENEIASVTHKNSVAEDDFSAI
jgi:hypothetical protein